MMLQYVNQARTKVSRGKHYSVSLSLSLYYITQLSPIHLHLLHYPIVSPVHITYTYIPSIGPRMDPHPIPFSSADLERRRLESTINQDLHSLSLASGSSSASDAHFPPRSQSRHSHHHHGVESDTSFSSLSTIEYPRAAEVAYPSNPDISFHQSMYPKLVGPHGTPRAANRKVSQMSERSYLDASPVSTAGHHVSAVTLAEGVFKRAVGVGKGLHGDESGSEWDPDRSLGRLVGELGKAMKNVRAFRI
jgi:hypothetical protein